MTTIAFFFLLYACVWTASIFAAADLLADHYGCPCQDLLDDEDDDW